MYFCFRRRLCSAGPESLLGRGRTWDIGSQVWRINFHRDLPTLPLLKQLTLAPMLRKGGRVPSPNLTHL